MDEWVRQLVENNKENTGTDRHMALAKQAPRIVPFWQRIPQFFLYPLRPPALWLPLSVAAILALTLPKLGGLMIFLLLLFLVFLLFTYGYESLDATAQGNTEPPGIREVMAAGDWGLPLKQLGILFVFGAFVTMADRLLGELGSALTGFMLSLLLPASVMVLGVERSFMAAVNPVSGTWRGLSAGPFWACSDCCWRRKAPWAAPC